jgi:hypothetical protein
MLNMKKGLAIVLAAATALTFAPVSTLGLTGVVEAQAASGDGYATKKDAAANIQDWAWDQSATAKTLDLTSKGSGGAYIAYKITGSKDDTDDYDYKIEYDKEYVGLWATQDSNDVVAEDSFTMKNAATAPTKTVGLQAKKAGTTVVTISHRKKGDTNWTSAKLTLTIKAPITGPATFVDGKNTVTAVTLYNGAGDKTIKVHVPDSDKGTEMYAAISDTTIATVSGTSPITVTPGTDTSLTLEPHAAGDPVTLSIYSNANDLADKKNSLGSLKITVKDPKHDITTKTVTAGGDRETFTYIEDNAHQTPTVSFSKDGKAVSGLHLYEGPTSKSYLSSLSSTSVGENTFYVGADADVTPGKYTVTVGIVSQDFQVIAGSGKNTSDDPATSGKATDSAVYGGVTTKLIATDSTNYSLVNSNARFKLGSVWYTADQLKWYLTSQPSANPVALGFTNDSAKVTDSKGKLDVHVNNAKTFKNDMTGANIVGVYEAGGKNTLVYSGTINVVDTPQAVATRKISKSFSKTVNDVKTGTPVQKDFLKGTTFIGVNNNKLNKGNDLSITTDKYEGQIFDANITDAAAAKDSTITRHVGADGKEVVPSRNGVYYETYYVPYTDVKNNTRFIAEISVTISVNAGPKVRVQDGDITYSRVNDNPTDIDDAVIDLDLTTNKTFDLTKYLYSNMDNTTYSYDTYDENVTVDKGVVTAAKVGTSTVKITPSANGVNGDPVFVFFRVSQNAGDVISVTGKDSDVATTLTNRQFQGNRTLLSTEAGLAAAQVGYVQIEVTGDETNDVKEPLTVKGKGNLSYALVNEEDKNVSIDAKTGQITVSHDFLQKNFKDQKTNTQPYVFPVKVTSTETNTTALTTRYFYVVVDYADAQITGLEDSYEVGTSPSDTDPASWLNLGITKGEGEKRVSTNASSNTSYYHVVALNRNSDLNDSMLYTDDDNTVFVPYNNSIEYAITAGKTEHVLVENYDTYHKIGHTYKVVTIKSVAGQYNNVTKIENVTTGETIYDNATAAVSGASITITKPTVVKVTVAHAPSAALNAKDDPAFTIGDGDHAGFNWNTDHLFVAATENPHTYQVTLIPSIKGTQIIKINPTQDRLSKSDYSLVGTESFNLAVKNEGESANVNVPAKVKKVVVRNVKGAKAKISYSQLKNVAGYKVVYKYKKNGKLVRKTFVNKAGKGSKVVSVPKNTSVKVWVRAYNLNDNGQRVNGAYRTKTFKTDKK